MKKILLLGSAGMAGQILKLELLKLTDQIELVDVARNNKTSKPKIQLDLTNFVQLEDIINNGNFDFIINCVGLLNSFAEEHPDQAILINSYLPHFLEKTTSSTNTKIIHISTDCVFSGKSGNYKESDFKDGVGFYAQSKALGEVINSKDLTIRTSILGPDLNISGIGLFKWLMNQNGIINGYTKAFWSGVTTIQLSKVILEIINRTSIPTGLIHLTNNAKISKFDLLNIIKNVFELKNLEIVEYNNYEVDKSLVNTRNDLNIKVPGYLEMILEMREWMNKNKY
jgi:dTDP-4-dehydrorhamnose reductase